MSVVIKLGACPFCGEPLPAYPETVHIRLNNGTVMPQPSCLKCRPQLFDKEIQKELLEACKEYWKKEIQEDATKDESMKKYLLGVTELLEVFEEKENNESTTARQTS